MAIPYEAAIKLSLTSNVAEGLAVIIARLTGTQAEVKKLEAGIAALKPAILGAVAAFAGKNASNASSDRVMSRGVPNTVVVEMNERSPASVTNSSGTSTPP